MAAYARKNSRTGAREHFPVPRTTINRWMKDRYIEKKTTKKYTEKGSGRHITYGVDKDEQLLVWFLMHVASNFLSQHKSCEGKGLRADLPRSCSVQNH